VQGLKGRWDAAAQACLHDVAEELQELTGSLVAQHFGQFSRADMYIRWAGGWWHSFLGSLLAQHFGQFSRADMYIR
jgi:hypothetical protein